MSQTPNAIPMAVSVGDPAGIGPEIIGKAWQARSDANLQPFFAVGNIRSFAPHWAGPVVQINDPSEAVNCFADALPVLNVHDCLPAVPGKPDIDGAQCAYQSLELAVGLAKSGNASAVITAPVSKAQLYAVGFTHPGQTEFIAERCGITPNNAVMMLAGPGLRVVPMTTHIPLNAVAAKLDARVIRQRIRATAKGLQRDFGIQSPRLAIAGLNPHAGESGTMGREELDIFAPALAEIRREGYDIIGPLSADTMFHADARSQYDAALCAYHDQALIPLKTLYFHDAVNITLGLPIVRTSPDHGTAFAIAGQDKALPNSMIAALQMAAMAVKNRESFAASTV